MRRVITYNDFTAQMCGTWSIKDIKGGKYFYNLLVDNKTLDLLMKHITQKDRKDVFHESIVCLYFEYKGDDVFVDRHGRVRYKGEDYVINPLNFMLLRDDLERIKVKNRIFEGVPKYY